jgi:hypothetical protein
MSNAVPALVSSSARDEKSSDESKTRQGVVIGSLRMAAERGGYEEVVEGLGKEVVLHDGATTRGRMMIEL